MIDDARKLATFDSLLCAHIGGADVAEMLVERFAEGMTLPAIAELHQLPYPTVRLRIVRARVKLRALDLWPEQWDWQRDRVPRGTAVVVNRP